MGSRLSGRACYRGLETEWQTLLSFCGLTREYKPSRNCATRADGPTPAPPPKMVLKDMSYMYPVYPILATIAMILCLSPVPIHWRVGNIATVSLALWTAIGLLITVIDVCIWHGNIGAILYRYTWSCCQLPLQARLYAFNIVSGALREPRRYSSPSERYVLAFV